MFGKAADRSCSLRVRHGSEHEASDHVVQPTERDLIGQNLRNRAGRTGDRMAGFDELVERGWQLRVDRLRPVLAPELDEVLVERGPGLPAQLMGVAIGLADDDVAIDTDQRREALPCRLPAAISSR